jgi:hypothetical protein
MWRKLETNVRSLRSLWTRPLACALIFSIVACTGKHNQVVQNEEQDTGPHLTSTLRMGDPKAATQLVSGFYGIENNMWRWTAGKFSTLLQTPAGAAQNGATLTFTFTVPDVVIQKLKTVTLTASINGMALKSAEYNAAGAYTFSADVPASALKAEAVKVDFALDKSLPPDVDKRELGLIATAVALGSR